jgi:hypothetical protein
MVSGLKEINPVVSDEIDQPVLLGYTAGPAAL